MKKTHYRILVLISLVFVILMYSIDFNSLNKNLVHEVKHPELDKRLTFYKFRFFNEWKSANKVVLKTTDQNGLFATHAITFGKNHFKTINDIDWGDLNDSISIKITMEDGTINTLFLKN